MRSSAVAAATYFKPETEAATLVTGKPAPAPQTQSHVITVSDSTTSSESEAAVQMKVPCLVALTESNDPIFSCLTQILAKSALLS